MEKPDAIETPIVVNDIKIEGQIKQALIYIGIIATAIPTITQFISNRDLAGFINYIKGDQAAGLITAGSFFALVIWRQIAKRREVASAAIVAKASPVAVLKSEVAAAAPGDVS